MTRATPSRRALLVGSAALAAGAGAGAVGMRLSDGDAGANPVAARPDDAGPTTVPFYGEHQAGITTAQQTHVSLVGLDLVRGVDARGVEGVLRLLTDDAARLCAGRPPLGALEAVPAVGVRRLTVTFGFGPGLFAAAGVPQRCPAGVASIPAFSTDKLEDRWGQTDLLLQICSDDPTGVAYAQRRLLRDTTHAMTLRWAQHGFMPVAPEPGAPQQSSPRNLMGLRDGSANERDPAQVAAVVWSPGPGPMAGGTQLVLRRVRLDLGRWDDIDTAAKQLAFGRRMDGSPLTAPPGTSEFTVVDRTAVDEAGFTVVPPNAHAARTQARGAAERMLRRGYNYADGLHADGRPDEGLLFLAYQADAATAFVPVQRRLAEADALNTWATHVGSAAYAVPPGCAPGDWVGRTLLT